MMLLRKLLLRAKYDATFGQIVGRLLHSHFVAGQDANIVHAHLSRDMSEYDMAVFELDPKGRVGEVLLHLALHLDHVLLRHSCVLSFH